MNWAAITIRLRATIPTLGRNLRCPPLVSADTFDPTNNLQGVTVETAVVITTVESVTMIVVAAQLQPPRPQLTLQDLENIAHKRHLVSTWVSKSIMPPFIQPS